jgi:hypothetical protein
MGPEWLSLKYFTVAQAQIVVTMVLFWQDRQSNGWFESKT